MRSGWISLIIFLFILNPVFGEVEYKSVSLAPMPIKLQEIFEDSFKISELRRFLIDSSGSKVLGINMLFTDAFAMSRVAIKYDLEGNFELNKTYRFNGFNVIHIEFSKKNIAIMYSGVSAESINSIIRNIRSRSTTTSFKSLLINEAHASDDCNNASLTLKIDKDIPSKSVTSFIGSCLDNLGGGAEEATIGTASSMWNSVANEFKEFTNNPMERMGDYWEGVSGGLSKLWSFMGSVGGMIIDPVQGIKTLKAKFGEIGEFFVGVYENISSLPLQSKVDFICNIIGNLGIDILLTAVTVGAAGGKLGLSVATILAKLIKIAKIAGKGLALPFKTLNSLGDKIIEGIEKIIKGGNKDIFNKKLEVMGCAL